MVTGKDIVNKELFTYDEICAIRLNEVLHVNLLYHNVQLIKTGPLSIVFPHQLIISMIFGRLQG